MAVCRVIRIVHFVQFTVHPIRTMDDEVVRHSNTITGWLKVSTTSVS